MLTLGGGKQICEMRVAKGVSAAIRGATIWTHQATGWIRLILSCCSSLNVA